MAGLKIAYAPGVVPGKWLDRWRDRYPDAPLDAVRYDAGDPLPLLADGRADIVFVRFPEDGTPAGPRIHAIPLYTELPVVCAPKDHEIELYDGEVPVEELADAAFLDLADYPDEAGGTAMALEVVASGAALLVLPMSVARLHHRRDVVHRVLAGAPATRILVAWNRPEGDDPENPLIEEFIGIVRGRGENSSRQPSVQDKQRRDAERARKDRQGGAPAAGKGAAKSGKGSGRSGGQAGRPAKGGPGGGAKRGKRPGGGRGR